MHIAATDPSSSVSRRRDRLRPSKKRRTSIAAQATRDRQAAPVWIDRPKARCRSLRRGLLVEPALRKDPAITIGQLIATPVGKLGENIAVSRFARSKSARKSPRYRLDQVRAAGERSNNHEARRLRP